MTRVSARTRGSCCRRLGNMGYCWEMVVRDVVDVEMEVVLLWRHTLPTGRIQPERRHRGSTAPARVRCPSCTGTRPIACPGNQISALLNQSQQLPDDTYRHEQNHPTNTQQPPNIINLLQNLPSRQPSTIHPRRREIKHGRHYQPNEVPNPAQQSNPPPTRMRGDQLPP